MNIEEHLRMIYSAIPSGCTIELQLQSGYYTVTLYTRGGGSVYFNRSGNITNGLSDALKYALDEVEQFRRKAEIMESVNDHP